MKGLAAKTLFLLVFLASTSVPAAEGHQDATPETYRLLSLFSEAFRVIRSESVHPISDQQLIEAAISGMVSATDNRGKFLSTPDYENLRTNVAGAFGGIGVELRKQGTSFKVVRVLEDSPAMHAGLKAKDEIMEINGETLESYQLQEVAHQLKGKKGEKITLMLKSPAGKVAQKKLVKDTIALQKMTSELKDGIAYIRLASFQDKNTARLLKDSIMDLQNQIDYPLKGLILDLTGNGGGLLDQAIEVTNLFLEDKEITSLKGRDMKKTKTYTAGKGALLKQIPIVLLIDNDTASASEIVAGALKDHGRAVLVGTPTFGKASVQSILPLADEAVALRLTTHHYYTPKGHDIHENGIAPDYVVLKKEGTTSKDASKLYATELLQAH